MLRMATIRCVLFVKQPTLKINEIRSEGNHVQVRKTAQERLTASEQEQYESEDHYSGWSVLHASSLRQP